MIVKLFHLVTLPKCCTMKSMNIPGYCNNHSSGNPVIAWFTQSCPCFHSYLVLVPCARHPAFQEADSATNFEFLRFTFGWDNVFIPLLLFNSVGQIRNRHRMKESTWNRLQYNWTGLKKTISFQYTLQSRALRYTWTKTEYDKSHYGTRSSWGLQYSTENQNDPIECMMNYFSPWHLLNT